MPDDNLSVRATDISQFVRHHSCERRLRLAHNKGEAAESLPFSGRLLNALDPILQSKGDQLEEDYAESLKDQGLEQLEINNEEAAVSESGEGTEGPDFQNFREMAESTERGESRFARELGIKGSIGAFEVSGRADFLIIRWEEDAPILRVVETKSSRKDKTHHRIQLAAYKLLLNQILEENPLSLQGNEIGPEEVEYVVGRIDDSTNQIEDILELEPLPLSSESDDVESLLSDGGKFESILTTPPSDIDSLDYRLDPKCDQCIYDVHCFPETGRQRGLELIGLSPTAIRAMEEAGLENIDDLASLDLHSDAARELRTSHAIRQDLGALQSRAQARRQTLPETSEDEEYQVQGADNNAQSQLPPHEIDGDRVIRVYLNVDYDYSEDRVAALAAHITRSDWVLSTPLDWNETQDGHEMEVEPEVVEVPHPDMDDSTGTREVQGETIVEHHPDEWTGAYESDTGSERGFIITFLRDLVDEVQNIAESDEEYIHFYVWSDSEITHLMDACSRGGRSVLSHLRELLGCREPLEQLIYSSLRNEVDNRYALGWTGRGLSVATSLRWFGDRYHWTREVGGEEVELDRVFEQDIFDFKSTLGLNDDGGWADDRDEADEAYKFEIRSRFFDSLPVPYMHVIWGSLIEPEQVSGNSRLSRQLKRYHRADRRRLKEYLKSRTHALRWIDEKIRFYNDDIQKQSLSIDELEGYSLGVEDAAEAAMDFLLLDQHVKAAEWLSDCMQPPTHRVPQGEAIPITNGGYVDIDGETRIVAELDFGPYDIDLEEFRLRTSFGEGSWCRVNPMLSPERGSTFSQLTDTGSIVEIDFIDWDEGELILSPRYSGNDRRFELPSYHDNPGEELYGGEDVILNDSLSDFVARRVYHRLDSRQGEHAVRWLDPESPTLPPVNPVDEEVQIQYREILRTIEVGDGDELQNHQVDAAIDGLDTRVQLIHGPPGTGKTTTTAIAILLRILHHIEEGDTIVVAGNTHRSVNTLLTDLYEHLGEFAEKARDLGYEVPDISIFKVGRQGGDELSDGIESIGTRGILRSHLNPAVNDGVLVIGGTTSGVLKTFIYLDGTSWGGDNNEFLAQELVVDEASMMVFPHFLSLATTVDRDARILLAGDHRQLSPIVAHDWEDEDRPPIEIYKPFSSSFEAIKDLQESEDIGENTISLSRLPYTFRLPLTIRLLISQLYESRDGVPLEGEESCAEGVCELEGSNPLEEIWNEDTGIFLITHSERESRVSNEFEAELIESILDADAADSLGEDSVSLLTPHRAQRSLLQEIFEDEVDNGPIEVVDTVERLQGGECRNIIVSATASDPTAISENEQFLLDLNRANVAFSRAQQRLIVVCSEGFLNHIPPEVEDYNAAMLWKSVRSLCSIPVGESIDLDGEQIQVYSPDPEEVDRILSERE